MQADWCCLLANTTEGPVHANKSLIVVPMDAKGITRQKINKLGMRASDTAQLFFDDVRVPQRNRIGEEGMGFMMQMVQFQEERLLRRANSLNGLDRLIDATIEYCGERRRFGKPLLDNQVIHFRMAELRTEVEALRSLIYRAVEDYVGGADVTLLASMAKLKAGRLAREVSDSCLQYWGGMGFTWDNPVGARLSRHAPALDRRRRRRDHARHHLQAERHPARHRQQAPRQRGRTLTGIAFAALSICFNIGICAKTASHFSVRCSSLSVSAQAHPAACCAPVRRCCAGGWCCCGCQPWRDSRSARSAPHEQVCRRRAC